MMLVYPGYVKSGIWIHTFLLTVYFHRLYWQVIPGLDQTQTGASADCVWDASEIGLESAKGDVEGAAHAACEASADRAWII